MSFRTGRGRLDMTNSTQAPTTISNIGVVMFTVADQDAALAFYTEKLGFEVRSDSRFGENGEHRWLEVAPPGSNARLALNPPMSNQPGGQRHRRRDARRPGRARPSERHRRHRPRPRADVGSGRAAAVHAA